MICSAAPNGLLKRSSRLFLKKLNHCIFLLEGDTIRGWRWNKGGDKKALIVHGYESTVLNFDRYIKPLVKKGYEVLAFDAPAHGRSGGKKINAPLYKKMILEINRQFGPLDAMIAHSFGGLAAALAMEEINHTANHKMVLIAPATETPTAIDSFFRFLKLDPALRDEFERIIVQKGGVSSAWYSIRRAMKHIRASVLWVHDEDDDTTPWADAQKVKAENHPNIHFVVTSGLGHRRIYRDNKVSRTILDFL
ncbi:MAG: alpha/beta fold hydrolase [Chitinophagaceae bacterium]|nr:alpha/beta fold hydrolase [Chitinophagaceae bacterium]